MRILWYCARVNNVVVRGGGGGGWVVVLAVIRYCMSESRMRDVTDMCERESPFGLICFFIFCVIDLASVPFLLGYSLFTVEWLCCFRQKKQTKKKVGVKNDAGKHELGWRPIGWGFICVRRVTVFNIGWFARLGLIWWAKVWSVWFSKKNSLKHACFCVYIKSINRVFGSKFWKLV